MIPLLYQLSYTGTDFVWAPETSERAPEMPEGFESSRYPPVRPRTDRPDSGFCNALAGILIPRACLACSAPRRSPEGHRGGGVCGRCASEFAAGAEFCARCARTGDNPDPACALCDRDCLSVPLRVVGEYRGSLRELIIEAKWRRLRAAELPLGRWLADAARPGGWAGPLECVCAVPRDRWRRWLRGSPLSQALAREAAAHLGLPVVDPLRRHRRRPQAKLSGEARRRNLDGATYVPARLRGKVAGRRVLLIDDVVTTGATIESGAAALLSAGAIEVRALAVAQTPLTSTDDDL